MRTVLSWLACLSIVLGGLRSSDAAVVYVDSGAADCGDGQSWATAYKHLQDALTAARNSGGTITEIWVAAGTYKPDRDCANPSGTGDRAAKFEFPEETTVLGGFPGQPGQEGNLSVRNPQAHRSTLSGDLAGDDGPDFTNNEENSNSVLRAVHVGSSFVLDGFTISGGNASGPSSAFQGGGMMMRSSTGMVVNCITNVKLSSAPSCNASTKADQSALALFNPFENLRL